MLYCEKCHRAFEGDACPNCGGTRLRAPMPGDECFLTEQNRVWSGMLEDVLRQQGVPFYVKRRLGAAMTMRAGTMLEGYRFYVPYEALDRAGEVVASLFGGAEAEP